MFHQDVIDLRVFFEDIAEWGWPSAPTRRLFFLGDIPRMPDALPRALPPAIDRDLMAAVARLDDRFARVGIGLLPRPACAPASCSILRSAASSTSRPGAVGSRSPSASSEPNAWSPSNPTRLPCSMSGWNTEVLTGRSRTHVTATSPTSCSANEDAGSANTASASASGPAVADAGLTDPTGAPLRVTLHQLRHTFGTSLVNAGMSLPALMALLGHVTPEMTLRYAKVASPTIRDAYDTAMAKVRGRRPLYVIPAGATPTVPAKIDWLHDEMLKTRLAHGFCSAIRSPARVATPASREQCDNFVPDPNRVDVLEQQLADVVVLRDDARARGWTDETARHDRVTNDLERHLRRLNRKPAND